VLRSIGQFALTPKALANFSPGLERQRQPWGPSQKTLNPEGVCLKAGPFRLNILFPCYPGFSLCFEPWAEISERLRRIQMSKAILEVIVCSVADAIEAHKGGAARLEVVRDLDRGGLTPRSELVRAIKEAVELPLRVMVRESAGFGVTDEMETERLCDAASEFSSLGVDGLVLGFLKRGTIDLELTSRVLACAPGLNATFHHAFEGAADQLQAVSQLKSLAQVDRILSSGGLGKLEQRRGRLVAYEQAAAPEIKVIAGGGIDRNAIEILRRTTAIREFHVGRAARRGFNVTGPVQAELVSELDQGSRVPR
jgi:copper homeostasis protein